MQASETKPSAEAQYNATVEILRQTPRTRVIRVYPSGSKTRYGGGQYGSLGLTSRTKPGNILKRPYSLSSSIVDLGMGQIIDYNEVDYYEFYFNLVEETLAHKREQLTPKLFSLKDGDRVFCGSKIVGYYTLDKVPVTNDVLLIATTTGEAANNSIINQLLLEQRPGRVCSITLGPEGWESLYAKEHEMLGCLRETYRSLALNVSGYEAVESLVARCCQDKTYGLQRLGFELRPDSSHIFLCGDPGMIGAPKKMGAWNYEAPQVGLIPVLEQFGFTVSTKFKHGSVDYETYW